MALNLRLVQGPEVGNLILTAVLASVLANEFWSSRLLKGLLIDGGRVAT